MLAAKRIIQDLYRSQLGWDDALPVAAAKEWTVWLQELHQLEDFKVDGCLKPLNFGEVASSQLHHFADTSEDGHRTVTYLLLRNIRRQVQRKEQLEERIQEEMHSIRPQAARGSLSIEEFDKA